ncbi:MAG: hypothetical protein SFZ24_02915, partial [Planctomycetota bacterium]|nr:hypothetical protein [Planctomycetota bacterium]
FNLPYLFNTSEADWNATGRTLCICPWHTPERGLVIIERNEAGEIVGREVPQRELPDWSGRIVPQSQLPDWAIQRLIFGNTDTPSADEAP